MSADGVISFDGTNYRAAYQQSSRMNPIRLGPVGSELLTFASEQLAIDAIEYRARLDGQGVTIRAGNYPRGTRKHGEIISQM